MLAYSHSVSAGKRAFALLSQRSLLLSAPETARHVSAAQRLNTHRFRVGIDVSSKTSSILSSNRCCIIYSAVRTSSNATPPEPVAAADKTEPKKPSAFKSWMVLGKLRLNMLVGWTAVIPFMMSGRADLFTGLALIAGVMSTSMGSAMGNQIIEREHDAKMRRTNRRPLITGDINLSTAKAVTALTTVGGSVLLWTCVNPMTSILATATYLGYWYLYTPSKRLHRWNTELGAVVGAIPPVMGWTAAGFSMWSPEAMTFFFIQFAWQMQHFMIICAAHQSDYIKGGYVMQSQDDPDLSKTARKAFWWTASLLLAAPLCSHLDLTGPSFALLGTGMSSILVYTMHRWQQEPLNRARRGAAFGMGFLWCLAFWAGLAVFYFKEIRQFEAMYIRPILDKAGDAARPLVPQWALPIRDAWNDAVEKRYLMMAYRNLTLLHKLQTDYSKEMKLRFKAAEKQRREQDQAASTTAQAQVQVDSTAPSLPNPANTTTASSALSLKGA